jgi:AcrR family transcriptional regulator
MARRVGVTREQVIDAAVAIADRDGWDAVSLATVAAAVGVRSPSLYAHVEGLEGLRQALRVRANRLLIVALAAAVAEAGSGRDALRAIGRAYRAFAHAHPGLYPAQAAALAPGADQTGENGEATDPIGMVASLLADLDVPEERQVHLARTFLAMLHGFLDLELAEAFGFGGSVDESFESTLDLLIRAVAPTTPG